MQISSLTPPTTDQCLFSRASLGSIADEAGCYVICAFDGTILYIGQSQNINQRVRQHLDDGSKSVRTPWGVAQWLHYRLCRKADLDQLESAWVSQFTMQNGGDLPYFNKVHPPSG